jgi:hypothetical protein
MQRKMGSKKSPKAKSPAIPNKPPPFDASVTFGKTMRFSCTTAVNLSVQRSDLLAMFVMATGANTSYRLMSAVKLRRIRIWSNPPGVAAAGARTTSILWLSEQGPARLVSDSGIGSTFGAKLSSVPPSGSLAGFWSITGVDESVQLFILQLNVGDVVDVDLTFQLQNDMFGGTQTTPTSQSITGGTVGQVFVRALGFGSSASDVPPVDYPTA